MATIGNFTKSGNDFIGDITILGFQAKGVRVVPVSRLGSVDKLPL